MNGRLIQHAVEKLISLTISLINSILLFRSVLGDSVNFHTSKGHISQK